MKRLIYGVLIVLLAWTAYQNKTVQEFVEQGPGEVIAKLRNWANDYSPEALQERMAGSLKIDTEARDYLNEISRRKQDLEEFHFRYCQREAIDHPVLSSQQLEQVCKHAGELLGK